MLLLIGCLMEDLDQSSISCIISLLYFLTRSFCVWLLRSSCLVTWKCIFNFFCPSIVRQLYSDIWRDLDHSMLWTTTHPFAWCCFMSNSLFVIFSHKKDKVITAFWIYEIENLVGSQLMQDLVFGLWSMIWFLSFFYVSFVFLCWYEDEYRGILSSYFVTC